MGFFSKLFGKPRQPDLKFAAEGYFPIAMMRANGVEMDFHQLELSNAMAMLKQGCTEHQALSARWGGVTASGQDMQLFRRYADNYDETLQSMGLARDGSVASAETKFRTAAMMMVTLTMADAPGEFERFLKYIGK